MFVEAHCPCVHQKNFLLNDAFWMTSLPRSDVNRASSHLFSHQVSICTALHMDALQFESKPSLCPFALLIGPVLIWLLYGHKLLCNWKSEQLHKQFMLCANSCYNHDYFRTISQLLASTLSDCSTSKFISTFQKHQ